MPDKPLTYIDGLQAFKDTKGDLDITVGGDAAGDEGIFHEEIKIRVNKEWPNMFKVSSRLVTDGLFDKETSAKSILDVNGKVISSTDLITNEYFDIVDKDGIVEGKEHQITLNEVPKNGELPFSFLLKGCELYEQPPLTSEFKAGWSDKFKCEIDVTETDVIDTKTGRILVHRPIEYVNSHAIYNNQGLANNIIYPDNRNANYFTGKFLHRKRDFATLPDGKIVWLNPVFDKKTGIMTVKLPDELLRDESLYKAGLKIDPTFGYTTAGASYTSLAANTAHGFVASGLLYTANTGDVLTLISLYCWNGSTGQGVGLYSMSSGLPATRIYYGVTNATFGADWKTPGALTTALTNGVTYTVALNPISSYYADIYYDDATGNISSICTSGLAEPWSHSSYNTTNKWSLFGTIAAGAAATFKSYARWID
jgi:hypothetical protein